MQQLFYTLRVVLFRYILFVIKSLNYSLDLKESYNTAKPKSHEPWKGCSRGFRTKGTHFTETVMQPIQGVCWEFTNYEEFTLIKRHKCFNCDRILGHHVSVDT